MNGGRGTARDMDQARNRARLHALFGDLPPRDRPIGVRKIAEEDRGTYVLESLVLDLNGLEPVPAYFTRPRTGQAPWPAVLFNHSHGGFYDSGKKELVAGQEYMARPPYAELLARRGLACLCIDHWAFGERRGRTEGELFRLFLWKGAALWGMMVHDSLKALEYLRSRQDVDAASIVTLGMSMGASMAIWVAALDEGVRACVDICGQTDWDALIAARDLERHGIYYFVPGLLKRFSMSSLDALIAPRPHLAIAGDFDQLTPAAGLDRIDREVAKSYAALGAEGAWSLRRFPIGHYETAETRRAVEDFLDGLAGR
jgi:dienelactone hydrolase